MRGRLSSSLMRVGEMVRCIDAFRDDLGAIGRQAKPFFAGLRLMTTSREKTSLPGTFGLAMSPPQNGKG